MAKKPPADPNLFAKRVFDSLLTKLDPDAVPEVQAEPEGKDPKAVAAGHLGGLSGGRARAAKLSPTKRKQIARKAAKARWSKRQS